MQVFVKVSIWNTGESLLHVSPKAIRKPRQFRREEASRELAAILRKQLPIVPFQEEGEETGRSHGQTDPNRGIKFVRGRWKSQDVGRKSSSLTSSLAGVITKDPHAVPWGAI